MVCGCLLVEGEWFFGEGDDCIEDVVGVDCGDLGQVGLACGSDLD